MSENEREWQREREGGGERNKGLYDKRERYVCILNVYRGCSKMLFE